MGDSGRLNLSGLRPEAAEKAGPFFKEVLALYGASIHSIHVVGSALTEDFVPKKSDINSVLLFNEIDLKLIESFAALGKKYGPKGIAAPLTMTPEYIRGSVDVFPVEFLSFRLVHRTVYGEDILRGIEINRKDLRLQCERELKVRLIGLRQGYLSSRGEERKLSEGLVKSLSGFMPLLRGIIFLLGEEPPANWADVLGAVSRLSGADVGAFEKTLLLRKGTSKFSAADLMEIFEQCYHSTERLGKIVDEIVV